MTPNASIEIMPEDAPQEAGWPHRAANFVFADYIGDVGNSKRARAAFCGSLALTAQVIERLKVSLVAIPYAAAETLQHTESAPLVGLVTMGAYFAWQSTVSETLARGMGYHPKFFAGIAEKAPWAVNLLSAALPGYQPANEKLADEVPLEDETRGGNKLWGQAKRSLTLPAVGSSPYVATASLNGESDSAIRNLYLSTNIGGAAVMGVIAGGVSETILKVGDHNPQLAESVQNAAADVKLWGGLAIALTLRGLLPELWKQRQTLGKKLGKGALKMLRFFRISEKAA